MKIGVSAELSTPESPVDPRFGRSKFFMVFDDSNGAWEIIDNNQNLEATQGAGIQSAANVVNAGCTVLISGHCGPKAFAALAAAGVSVYAVSGTTVRSAIEMYKQGKLCKMESADVSGHW